MRRHLLSLCAASALLAACSNEPAGEAAQQSIDSPVARTAAEEAPASRASALLALGTEALREERLFAPAADNALEHYLAAYDAAQAEGKEYGDTGRARLLDSVAVGPAHQAQQAFNDLYPFGLVWVQRAIERGEREEAARVIALLQRVRPGAESLARLQRALDAPAVAVAPAPTAAAAPATRRSERTQAAPPQPVAAAAAPPVPAASVAGEPKPAPPAASVPQAGALPVAASAGAVARAVVEPAPVDAIAAQPSATPEPKLLTQVPPRYPQRAMRQRIEGWVALRLTVAADGSVQAADVVDAQPEGVFDMEAIRAARRWKFAAPGRETRVERRMQFSLGG